jgi:GntR family transcriptional repressor for pyruvate dehydrogenase complex
MMSVDLKTLVDQLGYRRPAHLVVADAIRRQIATGALAAGERLPSERALADALGVGRATIRKAIHDLVADGLLESRIGRSGGAIVLAAHGGAAPPVEGAYEQSLRDTFDLRCALEPLAARRAAEEAPARAKAEIVELANAAAPSLGAYHSLDSRFHHAVAEASGNILLVEAIDAARTAFFMWANTLWVNVPFGGAGQEIAREAFRADHAPIAQAIADGAGERAARRMAAHLRRGLEQFQALLDERAS